LEIMHLKQITNRYFTFLKRLRAGGRSNMYGAIPYLAAAFGVDREQAFRIVCEWVDAEQGARVASAAADPIDAGAGMVRHAASPQPVPAGRPARPSRRSTRKGKSSGRKAA